MPEFPIYQHSPSELAALDAAKVGDFPGVMKAIDDGVSIDICDGRDVPWDVTLLMYASGSGNIELVEYLLSKGANYKRKDKGYMGEGGGRLAIHFAAEKGHFETVKILIEKGSNINSVSKTSPSTVLNSFVQKKNLNAVEWLLDNGADPNAANTSAGDGQAGIHYAIVSDDDVMVELLIRHGANPNLQDKTLYFPIHTCVMCGYVKCTKALLKAGASMNVENGGKMTPMHSLANGRDINHDLFHVVASNILNINSVDKLGRTPLDVAMANSHGAEIVEMLVKKGGISAKDVGKRLRT